MEIFLKNLLIASPVFVLVLIGYLIMRLSGWSNTMADNLSTFVFNVSLPVLLFRMMTKQADLPPVDTRLLIVFFGGCLVVFLLGRLVSWSFFKLDGVSQSIFGIGCVFSANVLLGLPLAKVLIGDEAFPSVALVLVFNALILWTLVSISIEWAVHGNLSVPGFVKTLKAIVKNPLVVSIICGAIFGQFHLGIPSFLDSPLEMVGQTGIPLSLLVLGMSLTQYSIRSQLNLSISITAIKLIVLPLVILCIAKLTGLPALETKAMVLLGSVGLGVNVFLMARHFKALEAPVASALLLSTFASSITIPLMLSLSG